MSIARMNRLFIQENPDLHGKVLYWLYEDIFNHEFNVSFGYPRSDVCDKCELFTAQIKAGERDGDQVTAQGWIPRRVVSAYDVVNASYLPTTINIYDLEIRSINNYRKSYDIASFLVSTNISRRCRFGNSKPCKYIRSSYVRRNCIYDNNRVSANISSYDYRWFLS